MSKEQHGAPSLVKLSGALGIDRAAALQAELSSALAGADKLLLDLSSVDDIDLAALQILYAARRSAKAQSKELHLSGGLPPKLVKRLVASGFLRAMVERAEEAENGLADF